MIRKAIPVVLALAAIAAVLDAQTPRPRRAPRAESRSFSFSFSGNRARIGVLVNTVPNPETDKLGAKIDGVTPGAPADKAGLKAGDVITRFNGTSLAGASGEDEEQSGPGQKLIDLVGDLSPGDTVKLEYRRGSDTKTATLVTEEQSAMWNMRTPPPMGGIVLPDHAPMALMEGDSGFCFGDAWCDLDLVTLNPDLGEYFGARDGILVVKAPADSALPLKSGDVILSIGGRKPTSPSHAMRILRSYDAGETVAIDIMRHERRQTISWTVPQSEGGWKVRSPGGQGEQSFFWNIPSPNVDGVRAAMRALEDAQRSMRGAVRQELEGTMHREEIRALRDALSRASAAL